MKIGDLISTTNIRHYFQGKEARGWGEYKAEKGKYMVFLYLGQEPKDGSKLLNPDDGLRALGWQMKK